MARRVGASRSSKSNGATLGFEAKLWQAADLLRNNLDAAQYKHVVLGLIFLKYISDAFEERRSELARLYADPSSDYFTESAEIRHEVLEDRDEYRSHNVFWVPGPARWEKLRAAATQPEIGRLVDDAMIAIEHENPSLRGVLNKEYGRPDLDKQNLGRLIDLVSNIGLGDAESRGKDLLGRVYEYFLGRFASAEGKKGGQFYTPRHVVRVLVEMLEPFNGRVYDPCCGSGGMFVQSERFVEAHGGRRGAIAIYGQESNPTTWRLCKMNLAIRGIDADLGPQNDDSFTHDLHPDLRADFVLANPPFNDSNWKGDLLREDKRWVYGVPPQSNANFAWVQHFIHHLAPNGIAGFVLANASMSSLSGDEAQIRRRIVEADQVDCMVDLPGKLFYSTQIPVCLWFLASNKASSGFRDRRGSTLFIDARALGSLVDRTHRELTDADIARIAGTYHAWRGQEEIGTYSDLPGFCRSVTTREIAENGFVLTPGRYVGAESDYSQAAEVSHENLLRDLGDQRSRIAQLGAQADELLRRYFLSRHSTWMARPLQEVIEVNPRRALQSGILAPYTQMSDLPTNGLRAADPVERAAAPGARFINGDVLLARITPCLENGKMAFVDFLPAGTVGWGSTEFIVMRSRPPLPPIFAYLIARWQPFLDHAIASMSGSSGRQRVQVAALLNFPVPTPTESDALTLQQLEQPMVDLMKVNDEHNQTLARLRDMLVSKRVPSDIGVRIAEPAS